jgi:predicted Rossmann fold flavoprotein
VLQSDYDIAVVGAGAAGLTAAIFAAREAPDARIVALDGAPKIGAKILISGGGRCNVTHDVVHPEDFFGVRNAVAKVLRTFPVPATVEWFRDLGVELKREETGKLFPTSDRARTVLDALLRGCGAEVRTGARVVGCRPGFVVELADGTSLTARKVILATGGRSVPKTGSDGFGYTLVRGLGHTVTEVFPALVPLVVTPGFWTTELSGTSVVAELLVRGATGRVLARESGSLLFTHFGFSGPVVLDISRALLAARRDDPAAALVANFLPGETFESLERYFLDESRKNPRATVGSVLRGRIPERLLDRLAPSLPIAKLSKDERRRIVRYLVELPLPVDRDRGFDYAEVTAGGVPLTEIDLATMASRPCPGLYLCGEILDVDGKIGGYNFQWAWATGRLAGRGAARDVGG